MQILKKAYEDLNDEMKIKIENLKVVHSAKLPYADDGFYATETEKRSMNIITSKEAKKEQIHSLVKYIRKLKRKDYLSILFIRRISRL